MNSDSAVCKMEVTRMCIFLSVLVCTVSTLAETPTNVPSPTTVTSGSLTPGPVTVGLDANSDDTGNQLATVAALDVTPISTGSSVNKAVNTESGLTTSPENTQGSSVTDTLSTMDMDIDSVTSGSSDIPLLTVSSTPPPDDNTSAVIDDESSGNVTLEPSTKIPIYLSAYFTLGGGWDGSGILPACQMALEHVNQRPDILPEYDLRMVWNDTQCEAGLGTRVFFDQLFRKPQKIMILGPACSTATQAVAETAYFWNLVTLSYAAASSALSNRKKYPFFYRTYMPDASYNPARIRLMREFGWKRVATIHENHELFSLAINDLLTLLREANITIISSESFSENPKNQIENLKSQDAKIIISNMYENKARRMFCEAYKRNMTGSDYVWMIIGWYKVNWWKIDDPDVHCTLQEMSLAVEGVQYIATESLQLSTSPEYTIAGITPKEYENMLRERMTWPENQGYVWNTLAPYGYDAAWAIALALNTSVEVLKTKIFDDGNTRRLENFTYDDREMAELFVSLLNATSFMGVSGPVGFTGGDRVGITQIEQLQAVCVAGWHLYKSTCYHLVSQPVLTTAATGDYCAEIQHGANLAYINNRQEYEFIMDMWQSSSEQLPARWFIAVFREGSAKNMSWIPEGSSPDVTDDGACVFMDFENGGKWQTINCAEKLPFICRVHADYKEVQVALFNELDNSLEWRKDIIWAGDGPPPDRTPKIIVTIVRQYQGLTPTLYFCVCAVSGVCILASFFFLGFNIKYRQQRFVKMSSPNLNNLIILGAVLVYIFVIVSGLDTNLVSEPVFEIMCYVKTWALSVGFVLAFGAMFSKTWRVHRVAAFKTPKRRIVTDKQLFLMVFVLLLIDVIILTLWQIIDPVKLQTKDLYPQDDPEIAHRIIQPYLRYCTCDTLTYWLGALYGYKGLLLIFGTFLAWETRKVSIPGLNDSKLIGISVYNVVILCLIGVAISVVISSNPEALFLFVSCIILFCTSITLIVVFVPKIIAVVKYPDGDPTQSGTRTRTNIGSEASVSNTTNMASENKQLKETIEELEKEIKKMESRVEMSGEIPKTSGGCGCWSCGLVCGFSPSRGKAYTADSIAPVSSNHHIEEGEPAGTSTATASF